MISANDQASAFIRNKPALTKAAFNKLLPELKAHAFTIAGIECLRIQQSIRDEIATIPQGALWADVKAAVLAQLDPYFVDPAADAETQEKQRRGANRRAELLVRTHTSMAYAQVAYEAADQERELFPFWQYVTLGDGGVRPSHAALDGIVLPHDHPFWKSHTPPWDWGCRCQFIPLTEDDVAELQDLDKALPPEKQKVLDKAAREKLEKENTIYRTSNLAEGTGHPVPYNIQSPAESGKPGAFTWQPGNLRPDVDQLRASHPDAFPAFEKWAKGQPLPEQKLTVWEWLSGSPIVGPDADPALPVTVIQETPDELLAKLGLNVPTWGASAAGDILGALKKSGAFHQSMAVSEVRGSALQKTGLFSDDGIRGEVQKILNILPPSIAQTLPKFAVEIVGDGSGVSLGEYDTTAHILRLNRKALQRLEKDLGRDPRETIWHETMHWMHLHGPAEYRKTISDHFKARTAGESIVQLAGYGKQSRGKRDKWYEAYAGRIYPNHPNDSADGEGLEIPTRYFQLFADPEKLALYRNNDPHFEETFKTMLSLFL